ncbi:MAG: LTA synthase family protein [Peptococcaceae bacterium]|nr:LTA synthase family protein [Peptococcaceae bacterium]
MKDKFRALLVSYVEMIGRFVDSISVKRNSNRVVAAGICLSFAFMALVFINWNLFMNPATDPWGHWVFAAACALVAVIALVTCFHVSVGEKYQRKFYTVLFFLMPVVSMQMVECYNGNFLWVFSPQTFFMNYFAYLLLYVVIFFISSRFRFTILLVNVVLYLFGMANFFVELFRGTPIVPMDVFSVGTGLNVAAGYTFTLSWQVIMATMMFVIILALNRQMVNIRPQLRRSKIIVRAVALAYVLIIASTVYGSDVLADHGFKPDFWNQSRGYHNSGVWYNFCLNTKYVHISAPDGYSSNDVEKIVDETVSSVDPNTDDNTSINLLTGEDNYTPTGQKPNIIAIMNETFSDPASLGNLQTTEDYLPFYHSLTENTIKGTLTVPVFGAGTSNSEYEFLTGNSISSLPAGSSVYESYIKSAQPSLVSTLSDQGYSKTAFHPYFADGWNRPNVYKEMGFERFVSMSDLIDPTIVDEYKETNDDATFISEVEAKYPGENMLLRRFVSDSYDMKKVTEMYEQRDTSKPFFLFNVTMQNHGGYDKSYSNFTEDVHITNMMGYYPKAERYLSLLKQSDKALQELITYFSNVSEPTVIVMFGDHQASIENGFYEELYGKSTDDLTAEEEQTRYHTPFMIWANYDIPEATVNDISANYLSTLLLQTAGLEMTDYNKYLAALYQQVPVITTVGYKGADGKVYDYDDKDSPYASAVLGYDCLMYNNLLDTKNRDWNLFTVTGQPMANATDVKGTTDSASKSDSAASSSTSELQTAS